MPTKLFITEDNEPVFMSQIGDRFSTKRDAEHPRIAAFIHPGIPGNSVSDFVPKMEMQIGKKVLTSAVARLRPVPEANAAWALVPIAGAILLPKRSAWD
jgi:hypothetical protein